MTEIERFEVAPFDPGAQALALLQGEARREGFDFLDRLEGHWLSGENRFNRDGEKLLAVHDNTKLVAIGGLNHAPYAGKEGIGRLRHFYVAPAYRRKGIGAALVAALLDGAAEHFHSIRLRTTTERGARFYESLGFNRTREEDATHHRRLND